MNSKKSLKIVKSNTQKKSIKSLKKAYNCQDFIVLKQDLKINYQDKNTKKIPPLEGILAKPGFIHKWLRYNQFEHKLTKIPADFKPDKYQLDPETILFYKCGHKLDASTIQWDKDIHQGYQLYLTHHNHMRSFLVAIKNKLIKIYTISQQFYFSDDQPIFSYYYNQLLTQFYCQKIFIGRSPKNNLTDYSGRYGARFNGNSILLHLKENQYLFIGHEMYQFTTQDEIIKFCSPIGNNDVPYPFAQSKENVYFMLDQKFIPQKYFDHLPKTRTKQTDLYEYFYEAEFKSKSQPMLEVKFLLQKEIDKQFVPYLGNDVKWFCGFMYPADFLQYFQTFYSLDPVDRPYISNHPFDVILNKFIQKFAASGKLNKIVLHFFYGQTEISKIPSMDSFSQHLLKGIYNPFLKDLGPRYQQLEPQFYNLLSTKLQKYLEKLN